MKKEKGKNSPRKKEKRFRDSPKEHLLCWLKRSSANSSSQGQTAAKRSQPTARANSAYLELKSSHWRCTMLARCAKSRVSSS